MKKNNFNQFHISLFFSDFLKTILILFIATILAFTLVRLSAIAVNIFSLYILAVALISVVTSGYIWGIFSSFLGIFSVNYFFTFPYNAFNFLLAGYPPAFFSMLVISTIISTLTVKIKKQALIFSEREKQAESLHDITKRLLTATGMDNIRTLALDYFSNFYHCSVIIYFGNPSIDQNYGMKLLTAQHTSIFENQIEKNAAQLCYDTSAVVGADTFSQTNIKGTYLPISTDDTVFGVIGLLSENEGLKQPKTLDFLGIMTSQLILAIERQNLFEKQQKILVETEKEKMRSNLLRAVSHDLRTPLTCIVFSATTVLEQNTALSKQQFQKLLNDIIQDAQWLIHMVENLLAVTRINNEHAVIKKQQEAVEEIVAATMVKIKKRFPDAQIKASVPQEFIMIPMDATLIMQVLINLLENAIVHSHSTEAILLDVVYTEQYAIFSIKDNGVGLDENEINHIFDGVFIEKTGDSTRGIGIGLSICKSIIFAHKGSISAENNKEGGATFRFTLPKKGEDINHGK